MITGESWNVYWGEYVRNSFLYGSEIVFHATDDVEFTNELMSPGTVINRWFSKVNYQVLRIEPSLPMIDGEGRYHLKLNASVDVDAGLLLRIIYYDRYDTEAGSQTIRDGEGDFQCPLKAFSYEIQLINAGATHIHFHSITISEIIDDEEVLSDTEQNKESNRKHKKADR